MELREGINSGGGRLVTTTTGRHCRNANDNSTICCQSTANADSAGVVVVDHHNHPYPSNQSFRQNNLRQDYQQHQSNYTCRCSAAAAAASVRRVPVEIDWREVDPYYSELSDCASFWTLINFTCDVIYSGLFVLFFIMGQDVESMFFEGLLNHINPILIYLIISLVINYGALRSLRGGKEKCFLVFSVMKALLFPVTISLLLMLVFFDVQEYFGTFWVSFVAIVSCYNATAALCLWSMLICNRYILLNESAQKRMRKQQRLQLLRNYDEVVACHCHHRHQSPPVPVPIAVVRHCESNQQNPSSIGGAGASAASLFASSMSLPKPGSSRKVRDSNCANKLILVCPPTTTEMLATTTPHAQSVNSSVYLPTESRIQYSSYNDGRADYEEDPDGDGYDDEDDEFQDVLSFGDEEDVLQVSTVHKVMQEIRLVDAKRKSSFCAGGGGSVTQQSNFDMSGDEGDSV